MKESGILMRPPMVRALLETDKWETRRPLKKNPPVQDGHAGPVFNWSRVQRVGHWFHIMSDDALGQFTVTSPYGIEGDRVYVREAMRRAAEDSPRSVYEADGAATPAEAWPWKRDVLPSMHMPRGCARLGMELSEVRLERLHAIDDRGALREGFPVTYANAVRRFGYKALFERGAVWEKTAPRENYLWFLDVIHGEGYSARNEWVWVLCWKRIDRFR